MTITRAKIWANTRYILLGFLLILLVTMGCDIAVREISKMQLFDEVAELPENHVGLVLGTSKYLRNGNINPYFKFRIDAASELYHSGKIKYILVSGDNGLKSYNEPKMMREALIKKGIPEDKIILDYAGFRTFDSVVRSKEVFGQDKITVISQKFQNERAIFIAKEKGIDAIAYNARDIDSTAASKVLMREKFARVKAVIDLFLIGTEPKYLGEKVEIPS